MTLTALDPRILPERIERLAALDRVSATISSKLQAVLPAGPVKDALSGTWLGHPLHPLLVTVPIGSLTAATVLDLVGGRRGRDAARTLVGFGTLSMVPTAAAGLSDWSDTLGAEQRVGLVHAATNDVALALYAASWLARRRGSHGRGVALALVGSVVLSAGGYLGGHLSYALGVGVDTTAFQGMPEDWTPVDGAIEVAEGALVGGTAAGVPVLLTRLPAAQGGRLVAIADRCTHRGGPLHEGSVVDGCVECPWHGSRFALTGAGGGTGVGLPAEPGGVVRGPATRPQPAYDVREVDGRVEVRRAEERALRTNPV